MLNLLEKLSEKLVVWINIFFREQKTTKQQIFCLLEAFGLIFTLSLEQVL